MQIRIGCTDGHAYESDHVPDEVIQAELDRVDGYISTGGLRGHRTKTVEEFCEMVKSFAMSKEVDGFAPNEVTLAINGVHRSFNPNHVVWCEYTLDS